MRPFYLWSVKCQKAYIIAHKHIHAEYAAKNILKIQQYIHITQPCELYGLSQIELIVVQAPRHIVIPSERMLRNQLVQIARARRFTLIEVRLP